MRVLGLTDEQCYLEELESKPLHDDEWQRFLRALTNGLSYFYRDLEQLEAVVARLKTQVSDGDGTVRVWSAGCSCGEEVYTLAALFEHRFKNVELWGTDINHHAVEHARRAIYSEWSLRHCPTGIRQRYFERCDGGFVVVPSLRERVNFSCQNLATDPPPLDTRWHAIVCRNVLIYYDDSTVNTIVHRLSNALQPGGIISFGAGESPPRAAGLVSEIFLGRVLYRRHEESEGSLAEPKCAPSEPDLDEETVLEPPIDVGFLEEATQLALEGRERRARLLLEVRAPEDDLLAQLSLGHLYQSLRALDQAAVCYHRADAVQPFSGEVQYFLAYTEFRRGNLESAMAGFRRALFLEPNFAHASCMLGYVARQLGQHSVFLSERQRCTALATNPETHTRLETHPIFHSRFLPQLDMLHP